MFKSIEEFFHSLTPKKIKQILVLIVVVIVAYFGRQWWFEKGDTINRIAPDLNADTISISITGAENGETETREYDVDLYGDRGQTLMSVLTNLNFHYFPASILPKGNEDKLKDGQYRYTISFTDDAENYLAVHYIPGHWSFTTEPDGDYTAVSFPECKELGNEFGYLLWVYSSDYNS